MVDLGKLMAAKGFKKLSKVQKIAKSGHTGGCDKLIKIHEFMVLELVKKYKRPIKYMAKSKCCVNLLLQFVFMGLGSM